MQLEAVMQVKGPVLILAGAGSGKTTVLVNRIANMVNFGNAYHSAYMPEHISMSDIENIELAVKNGSMDKDMLRSFTNEQGVKPYNILAITFTNKAANELRERLAMMLGEDASEINASTFHSTCVRILRREGEKVGFTSNFTIYDTDDSLKVLKEIYKSINIDEKMLPLRSSLSQIGRFKDSMLSPIMAEEEYASDFRMSMVAKIYTEYAKRLKAANAMDFDDIIYHTVRLFLDNEDVLNKYRNRYKYIMVDEYQDTNHAQYLLVGLLAGEHKNLCVVGDDDQSIYKFRGATIENILSFEQQFSGATVIKLEQNYRCTQNILDAANSVIANNTERKGKNLWTDNGVGDKINILKLKDEFEEGRYIADRISDHIASGGSFRENAVLYRLNAQSNAIEKVLLRSAIPYRIFGGIKFYERLEIKDIVAYLSVINNPADTLRLKRIINQPKRGIGDATVATCEEIAYTLGVSLFDVIKSSEEYAPIQKKSKPLMEFAKVIDDLIEFEKKNNTITELFDKLLKDSGYEEFLNSQGIEGQNRLENVMELKSNISNFKKENEEGTLSEFLEEIALYTDLDRADTSGDAVTLMTLHSAKGLEFENVFIAGMEEGIFPGTQSNFDPKEVEEERRLAYVGITRAKKSLHITSSWQRLLYGKTTVNQMSRFVKEIPAQVCEIEDKTVRIVDKNPYASPKSAPTAGKSIGVSGSFSKEKAVFSFSNGDNVVHKVFGSGVIVKITPMGNDKLVEIDFGEKGIKKIMANMAKLEKA